jgi:inner membrane transporter RhtA
VSVTARSVWLVLGGIVSVQVGAAFAKQLFDEVTPTTMVWLRLATSTVVLVALARPRLGGRSRADWLVVLGFGTALLTMNWAIYQSFARMPLGLAVTIEFLGPLTIALVGSRRRLDLLWVALAAVGVAMLGLDTTGVTVSGVAFALLAGACWAAYIPLSAATGRRWPGFSGLALASVVGAVVLAPYAVTAGAAGGAGGGAGGGNPLLDPAVVTIGVLVGLLSSVVPYSLELAALRTMPSHVFGILMSLEPAAAALAGVVLLSELLGVVQWVAVACVVIASVGVTRSLTTTVEPPPVLG